MPYIQFSARTVKKILREIGASPKDYLGQHFLLENAIAKKIVASAKLSKNDMVLEVGPGLGILTQELVTCAGTVITVEKDAIFAAYANKRFQGSSVKVVHNDILRFARRIEKYIHGPYFVVANLPYQISARFLRIFLSDISAKPKEMVLMLQREVAEKLIAPPGDLSKLSVLAQTYADIGILFDVAPAHFFPQPRVHSSIVRIMLKKKMPFIFPQQEDFFWRVVRIGFSAKRKTLVNNCAHGLHISAQTFKKVLNSLHLHENVRAQELTVADWIRLVDKLSEIHCS